MNEYGSNVGTAMVDATAGVTADKRHETFERDAVGFLDTLYRIAASLTPEPMAAEDLVQETMFKAYRAWHQYRPGTNLRAWLLTILRTTFFNEYRKARRAGMQIDIQRLEPTAVFASTQDSDPEARFFEQIVDEEVLGAVDALQTKFRHALVLRDIADLSYAEIAERTKVPIGTVKSRVFRARRTLQRNLYSYAVEMGYIREPNNAAISRSAA